MEYRLKQYALHQGALEIQYIEEFFLDFPRKKSASEVIQRLSDRDHQILMAEAPLPDDPSTVVPVSFKVSHELRANERDPKLADLVAQLEDCVEFDGRRVLYQWIGGTRKDWRGQGHFRALTEEQEVWALANGFDEILMKTKNRFYDMRATLAQLHFNVIQLRAAPRGQSRVQGVPQQAARPARPRHAPQPAAGDEAGTLEKGRLVPVVLWRSNPGSSFSSDISHLTASASSGVFARSSRPGPCRCTHRQSEADEK